MADPGLLEPGFFIFQPNFAKILQNCPERSIEIEQYKTVDAP